MSLPDFGWVYHHPDNPPTQCRCGRDFEQFAYALACPKCDVTEWWPNNKVPT